MMRPGVCSLVDANDLHARFGSIAHYLELYNTIWHRKFWEYLYVLEQFQELSVNGRGVSCLGFGCGMELTPLILAHQFYTAKVIATDAPSPEEVWTNTSQYLPGWKPLITKGYQLGLPRHVLDKVSYNTIDMNHLKDMGRQFDFIWSMSSLEHLGSMENSMKFLVDSSVKYLAPGGLAVHATEFNLSSNEHTYLTGPSVFFRQRDLEELALRCKQAGLIMGPLDLQRKNHPYNTHVSAPPYSIDEPHLNVSFDGWVITSVGIIIQKPRENT